MHDEKVLIETRYFLVGIQPGLLLGAKLNFKWRYFELYVGPFRFALDW